MSETVRTSVPVENRGSITLEIVRPEDVSAVLTLGHGAGSNLDQVFLKQLASELAILGIATVRYNFLYSEQKKKMPDRFPAASAAIKAVLRFTSETFPGIALFGGGKSFGGRMTSMTLAEGNESAAKGIIFYGFPLHPAGSPSVERAAHLDRVGLPLLFIQGTRDALATSDLIKPVVGSLSGATLLEIEGADHSFKGGGKAGGAKALALASAEWIAKVV